MKNHLFSLTNSMIILLFLHLPQLSSGQSLERAQQYSNAGHYAEAETMMQQLAEQNPDDRAIMLARAYNYSWWGKHQEALSAFSAILALDPDNLEALKGKAFTLFFNGETGPAVLAFETAARVAPGDYDIQIGKGLALLEEKEYKAAQWSFKRALEIRPNSAEAKQHLQTALLAPGLVEGDIWVGYSLLGGQENKINLRGLQLNVRASKKLRAIAKFDNSLALDILSLARSDKAAPMVSAGLIREWGKKSLTELEYGFRFLDKDLTQHFISGGQVFFFQPNIRLKLGGFAGFGQGLPGEWMTYFSANLPATKHIRVEPTYYYIQPPNSPGAEHRLQLGLQFQTNRGYQLNLYGLYGNTLIEEGGSRQPFFGWSLTGLAPFSKSVWGQFAFRQEKGVYYDFTSVALGLKLRINK